MGFVFNRRGILPEGCSIYFLPRIVGISLASELILTGRLFSAQEAFEMGLVSRVVAPEKLIKPPRIAKKALCHFWKNVLPSLI